MTSHCKKLLEEASENRVDQNNQVTERASKEQIQDSQMLNHRVNQESDQNIEYINLPGGIVPKSKNLENVVSVNSLVAPC